MDTYYSSVLRIVGGNGKVNNLVLNFPYSLHGADFNPMLMPADYAQLHIHNLSEVD